MEDNLCKQIRENLSEKVEENKNDIDEIRKTVNSVQGMLIAIY